MLIILKSLQTKITNYVSFRTNEKGWHISSGKAYSWRAVCGPTESSFKSIYMIIFIYILIWQNVTIPLIACFSKVADTAWETSAGWFFTPIVLVCRRTLSLATETMVSVKTRWSCLQSSLGERIPERGKFTHNKIQMCLNHLLIEYIQ